MNMLFDIHMLCVMGGMVYFAFMYVCIVYIRGCGEDRRGIRLCVIVVISEVGRPHDRIDWGGSGNNPHDLLRQLDEEMKKIF